MAISTAAENYMTSVKREQIITSLRDVEYRREFAADIGTGIAFQIRHLREGRGWTQDELAQRTGTGKQQETISQWENPNYGKYSLATLIELAAAFDVAPIVKFAPFGELIDWTANLNPARLAPPSFDAEFGSTTTMAVSPGVGVAADSDVSALMEQVAQTLAAASVAFHTTAEVGEEFESTIRKASPVENHYAQAA